jgi:hypothetical protein
MNLTLILPSVVTALQSLVPILDAHPVGGLLAIVLVVVILAMFRHQRPRR